MTTTKTPLRQDTRTALLEAGTDLMLEKDIPIPVSKKF
jgi:hypothetical protein